MNNTLHVVVIVVRLGRSAIGFLVGLAERATDPVLALVWRARGSEN